MIIRIVKMGFIPEQIDAFLENFELNKHNIRSFEGCSHLKLIRDIHNTNQFFTYSHWESEEHLNNYRNSSLFKGVWANTKNKFNQKPEAWSVEQIWGAE
ncbi:antibiotic biosynthesis monooxygenase family protein [Aquimarina sp. 2201CG5-10]|uniref:putative quinol monooxygenase n=1 Tax=Aquimarina callyspongiae TaxID=3098150 RepID=UPI002AB55A46|nr:antibiotic biosynthesis monooxygenase family protein [Aquimarina sp. 2201CG5-10]MDY8137915.1 antibiotic biosynthesis monooxygenase family protein [Aquimarina sp. 2201CG5-10]